jgi:RNA ligase (TIGR02306 family)
MERKLVTVRKVINVEPITNSDNLEHVTVDGWKVVCKRGDFQKDDLALFYEIDSFLPVRQEYEFLRKGCYKKLVDGTEGMRIRSIKLRGAISQGLLLPLSTFPDIDFSDTTKDYSTELGVTKWEVTSPVVMCGDAKGLFPIHLVPKTEQERVQNLTGWFGEYKNVEFECSVKLDGTSATYIWHNEELRICSRNLELKPEDTTNIYVKMALELKLSEKFKDIQENFAVQGEICGPGINGNPLKLLKPTFFVFDVYNIDVQGYYTPSQRRLLCEFVNLNHVPIWVENIKPFEMTMDELLKYAEGPCYFNGNLREGLVFKSTRTINNELLHFKVINNQYLLNE